MFTTESQSGKGDHTVNTSVVILSFSKINSAIFSRCVIVSSGRMADKSMPLIDFKPYIPSHYVMTDVYPKFIKTASIVAKGYSA